MAKGCCANGASTSNAALPTCSTPAACAPLASNSSLHAKGQRHGRMLHPDCPLRVGLRPHRSWRIFQFHPLRDDYATRKTDLIKRWLLKRPRYHRHFTPTHASWTNLVECFFSILTKQGLQQAVHKSKHELTLFLKSFVKEYNKRCGPFIWTKGPAKLRKIITLTKRFQKDMSK